MNTLTQKIEALWSAKVKDMLLELKSVRLASNRELARGIGIHHKTITNILTHGNSASATTARKVVRYYCTYFELDPKDITTNLLETPILDIVQPPPLQ
jgi:hypothetical protein